MQDVSVNTKKRLVSTIGKIIKQHRMDIGKTIYTISAEIGMSKSTWREAELGICKDINLSTFWKIAEGLDIQPAELLKEIQESLGEDYSLSGIN